MIPPRIKICGITRPEDALHAAHAGADAVGLVFYPKSPRYVSIERAVDILAALPPFVTAVGLFVNAEPAFVHARLRMLPLDMLQFHGNESPRAAAAYGRPWIKALRIRRGVNVLAEAQRYGEAGARGLLVDSYVPGVPGGTGKRFNWDCLPANSTLPLILAGGLDADNVGEAIEQVHPWAVDVSGGVERVDSNGQRQPGIKDWQAVSAFVRAVRQGTL